MSNISARSVNFTGSNVPTNTVVSNCHIADDIEFYDYAFDRVKVENNFATNIIFLGDITTSTIANNIVEGDIDFKKVSTANCVTGNKGNQILFGSGVGFFLLIKLQ